MSARTYSLDQVRRDKAESKHDPVLAAFREFEEADRALVQAHRDMADDLADLFGDRS